MSSKLTVIEEFENAPDRIDGVDGVETPDRVELQELPVGTVVQFYGSHPDSKYIGLIVGTDDHKQIKVWLKGRGNGAVGNLDAIVSLNFGDCPNPLEEGVMELGRNYVIPYFLYGRDDNLILQTTNRRIEHYTKIFVLKPTD